jgi:NAD(P)-dependent dehydrogenase (short-subunit alcohol dehydrogenase family)
MRIQGNPMIRWVYSRLETVFASTKTSTARQATLSCCQIYSGVSTVLRVRRSAVISRYGQPEEITEFLGFMVSPAANWMTGTSVRMDGGETKGI